MPSILTIIFGLVILVAIIAIRRRRAAKKAIELGRRRVEPTFTQSPGQRSPQVQGKTAPRVPSVVPARPQDQDNLRELDRRERLFREARTSAGDPVSQREAEGKVHDALRKERQQAMRSKSADERATASLHASLGTFIVADCETTGLSAKTDRLTEISAIRCDIYGEVIEAMSSLIRISDRLPDRIVQLTGITDRMIQEDGRTEGEVISDFPGFVARTPVFFHNAPFDTGFLTAAAVRSGFPASAISKLETHDTLAMTKAVSQGLAATSSRTSPSTLAFSRHRPIEGWRTRRRRRI
jgi:DNA polymerase III epsilon subunit-like protein